MLREKERERKKLMRLVEADDEAEWKMVVMVPIKQGKGKKRNVIKGEEGASPKRKEESVMDGTKRWYCIFT